MEDPKLPKQLTEASPLDEFTVTGNIYVDPKYSGSTMPDVSPITGEALTADNTLTNFTKNSNNSPDYAKSVEDTHTLFISNLDRGTARGNGHDYFLNYKRSTTSSIGDIYIINSKGGDFSATPRDKNKHYVPDSDGTLNIYIEGSTFGGNVMGFGSQAPDNGQSQSFTGNYEFTFKKSLTTWFAPTYGTGYGLGEGNANNNRYGTMYGNIDLLVDGSTATDNSCVLRGALLPGLGEDKAYLKAYFNDSNFRNQFGIIMTGGNTTNFKSVADLDVTIIGSTMNTFMVLPNGSTSSAANDGSNALEGNIALKVVDTRFSGGLVIGAGRTGDNLDGRGWVKGDISFEITGSTNNGVTSINKGKYGTEAMPGIVDGTIENSILTDKFIGFQTGGTGNEMYANTTLRIIGSTISGSTNGFLSSYENKYFGTAKLEVTASTIGNLDTDVRGVKHSGATFTMEFKESADKTNVGVITGQWSSITVDAGAKVYASSIAMDGEASTLNITLGSYLNTAELSNIGTINVIGEVENGDTIIVSGLTISELEDDTKVMVGETEYKYGFFDKQYSITAAGDLVLHTGETYLVNKEYTDGVETDLGPIGYTTVAKAQAAIADPSKTTITIYGLDEEHEGNDLDEDIVSKNFTISFVTDDDNEITFNDHTILIGDSTTVDSTSVKIAYTEDIKAITFGNIEHKATVSADFSEIGTLNLKGVTVGDAELSFNEDIFGSVYLADQAGFVGTLTISNSEIENLYVAASGLTADLSNDNIITNVYAEGNASAVDLGTSEIEKFVAGYSNGTTLASFEYEGAVNAEELYIGGDSEENKFGALKATITGGAVDTLYIAGPNDVVTGNADITFTGGEFDEVKFGEIEGKANITLSGGHFADDFAVENVAGKVNVTLAGGTAISFMNGEPTGNNLTDDAVYYGLVYGASVSGALDGGATGDTLNVEGNAKVESVANFKSLNVTGGTLNVAGGDKTSEVGNDNTIVINGSIVNRRGINAGSIEAEDLTNSGLIGVLRDDADDDGIVLSGDLVNSGYIKTSVLSVAGDFTNSGKITAVGDITVDGSFENSGDIYFRSTFDQYGVFAQEGGLNLGGVNVVNSGFISAASLTGVKNLTTSMMYITGGAVITGNITIDAGAEVAFTNKANSEIENGLTLGGTITMGDTSALIVSGELSSDSQTITINCGDLIGYNEVVHAESGVDSWTIKLAGAAAGNYSYVKDDTTVLIYSTDEVYVSTAFDEDGSNVYNGHKLLYGKNAFASVAEAVASAKSGAKIRIVGDYLGADVAAAGFDVVLDGATNVGSVTAKTVTVIGDSAISSIVAADGLTIKAGAVLTVAETLPDDLPITIDASAGTGSRLVLDVDSKFVTLKDGQVTVYAPGKTYTATILTGEAEHAGDLFIVAKDNVFFRKDQMGDKPVAFVDGDTTDAATGDALFLGVNVFGTREEAEAAAKANGGTLYLVGFTTDDGQTASAEVPTVYEFVAGGANSINGTATPGAADQTTLIGGASLSTYTYGLNTYYEDVTGDLTFVADKVNSTTRIYITGNTYGNVMNGNITATITDSTVGRTYIGAGSFGTEENPITIDVLIKDSSISAFHGIETETTADGYTVSTEVTNEDPAARQDINADINIKIYDTVIGGTFTVLNTNNCHWNGHGGTLLQTHFTSGAINVEIGGSTLTDNIRVGLSLEGGGKAPQAFNVPNTLHIVATDANTVTYASYLCEWDAIIVDATAQLQLNTLQYTTIGIGPENADQCDHNLDGYGALTQVMVNMSGYKSGTHAVIVASNRVYTDKDLSNITVIGDNDLTGQCELAYIITGEQLKSIYVFDKTDDMFVNSGYTDAINGTSDSVTGQEFLFNYNAHTDFEKALSYATEWHGTITVTGGAYEDQDFQGNNVTIRAGVKFDSISMADDADEINAERSTLIVENGAEIGVIDGSKENIASTLYVEDDTDFNTVVDFDNVFVDEDATATFLSLSGSNITIMASSLLTADELDLTDSTIVIDVTGYAGRPHQVLIAESDIVGYKAENVSIVGENADKFGAVLIDNSLVLTTSIPSDTFLNSEYSVETTGTILEDGTYLEYGFNAFSDTASALAGLGSRSNTLTITGGEIAGDLVMNGANFTLLEGALDGVVYATYEKDYRNQVITVENGSVGGIEMTAQEGSYRVTRATINLGDGAVVNGALVGAGDTNLNVIGNVSVAQGIENVKNLVVDASGCLTTTGIELVEGGTLYITGSSHDEGTNIHLVVDTETGYSVAPTAAEGLYVLEQGNDIYVLDLSRIYFDPTYTEAIDGTQHANGDTLFWGINAFSDRQAATDATVEGATLYVSNRNADFHTSNRAISLVITDSNMGVLVSGMTSGDRTENGDINILIENTTFGQNGNSWILNNSTAGNPWDHHNHVLGNVSVVVKASTIGGNTNRTTNVADYFDFSGTTFEFKLVDTIVRNDIEVMGDSNLRNGQTLYWTMENVIAPSDKWWWVMDGNAGNGGDMVFTIKDSSLGTAANSNFQLASQSTWQWGTPASTTNFTFNVENSTVYGSISPDRIGRDELTQYVGDKVLNVYGDNRILQTLWFKEINLNKDSSLQGNSIRMSTAGGTINIDVTGYDGPSKSFIYVSDSITGATNINVIGVDPGAYELVTTDNAVVLFDGSIGNVYWNPEYEKKNTGATSAYGDVLFVDGSLESGIANAFTDLEKAKLALPAGYKLIVTGTGDDFDGALFGTLESQEITEGDINMVVTDGNFTTRIIEDEDEEEVEVGAIIAAADMEGEKVFTGNATIEIAGGTYGKAAVLDDEGEVEEEAIFAEINGTREVSGGTSGLLVTFSTNDLYANLTDFDYMTIQGNIRVRGDISLVNALFIDCNGSLTVDGQLDAASIGEIVLTSSGYEGPSKIVLHSDNLSQAIIDAIDISVDNPDDGWYFDATDKNLWLVSSDPGNVYVNSTYTEAITGTTSARGDLLYFGINAVAEMGEAIAKTTSDFGLYVTGGSFAAADLANKGRSNVYIDGGSVGTLTVGNDESGTLTRIELTGAEGKAGIGTIDGDEAGYRLIIDKDSKVGTANNVQYIRIGLGQNTGITEANYIENGGRFVLDLSEYDGRTGNVLSIAGGLNNFLIPVEGETYSLAVVEVTNNANNDFGFYYDPTTNNIISVAMTGDVFVRSDANTSLNGVAYQGNTLVYGYNVSADDSATQRAAEGGTIYVNDITTPITLRPNVYTNAVITHSNLADTRLGPTSAGVREGDFTLDVIGSTFSTGNQYLAGRGSNDTDGRATFIVGTRDDEGEITDGVWDIKFRALKDDEGTIIAKSRHDNNGGNYVFKVTENVFMAGGVVNVLFEDYDIRGDFYLFDNVWNVDGEEVKELNVTMTNVNCPDSKWMWLWDPRDANSTKINVTITDSVFSGGTLSFGLFGNSLTDWHGEADVYINGVTVSGGTFSGGKGADGNEEGMTGTRTLHVSGTNSFNLLKQFTNIELADGAVLTGNTIALAGATVDDAGFIIRGKADYSDGAKEFIVAGTTITGVAQDKAQFLDADGNAIEGYVAVVGSTNVFVYTQDGVVYYSTDYTADNINGVAIEDAVTGKKNFLALGDNAVTSMEDAYKALALESRASKYLIIEGASDNALYAKGIKIVANGGRIGTLYASDAEGDVASADITLNSGLRVNNVIVATESSEITGNALITVGDGAELGANLNGAAEFVGGTSKLVFEGDATAFSITSFDEVTIQAESEVVLNQTFSGTSLVIDVTGFTGASKRVLTAKAGVIDPESLTVTAPGFSTEWITDGESKTLVLVSDTVTDVYVNTAWTEADVTNKFAGDMLLVWNKNAFNTVAGGAAVVGKDNVLYVEGDFATTDALAFSNASVELNGATVSLGAVTASGTALTIGSNEFTATSISGISALSVKADAVAISGAIAMAEDGKITIDVSTHTQDKNDVVVLSTESGITGLDKDIAVVGTDANRFYAYYNEEDGDIHMLQIDNLYVDIAFGTAGENIPEGATNPITHEPLVFGANAFYSLTDALGKLSDGMGLYVNGRPYDLRTNDIMSDLYLTNSDIPVLINGYTSGDQSFTGDVNVNIIDSAIGRSGNSTLVTKTTVENPWDHVNTVTGNVTVNVIGSTLGSATDARDINGADFIRVTDGDFNFNVSNSTVYANVEVYGDSPIANSEEVNVNFTNVVAPVDRSIWVTDGNRNNAGTINITLDKVNFGTGNMRVGVQSDWNYGDRNSSNKVTFNVSNTTIGGALTADSIDLDELTTYSGTKVLNVTAGDNAINQVLWFKTINMDASATLTADEIRMSSVTSKFVINATEYTGISKVIVSTTAGIFNLKDTDVTLTAAPESGYELFTDYDAEAKTMTSIVIKGALKDIYANEDYTVEDLTIGTSYNGEALFYGFNAFDTAADAIAAMTVDSDLYVTGNLSYEAVEGQAITINGDLINTGTFKLAGFVDGTQSDVIALTASSITGDGKFTTDNAAYTAVVVDNTVHLVLKKVDVFVNTAWEGLAEGETVEVPDGTAVIGTDAFAVADDAAAKVSSNGTITVLASDVKFSNAIVRTVTATSGSTIQNANIGTANGAGSLTLQSGAAATNAQVRNGALIVDDGAKVSGGLKISDGAVVAFGENTALDLDISASTTESAAVMTGYSIMTGSPAISITIAADQADGTYTVATDAASFDKVVTLKTVAAVITDTLTVNNTELIEGIEYTLGVTENGDLTLTKKVYEEPITITYVDTAWADLAEGETVTVPGGTATIGKDAFADADLATEKVISTGIVKVVGGKVTFANGITKQTEILSGAELTNTNVSSVLTVNAGATLSGKAAFADGANVTVNGTVVFDLAIAAEEAQFTGFNVAGEATYTLAGEAVVGDYTLATGVTAFTSLTVGDQTLAVGESIIVDDAFAYSLSLTEGTLALNIASYVPPVVIPAITYVNSIWATKAEGSKFMLDDGVTEVTYMYDAFATGDAAIAAVSADGEVKVLGGTVSFTDAIAKTVTISDGATLFGKAAFDVAITIDGTVAFDTAYTAEGAQFVGLSKVTGETKYTLAANAVVGTYTLATDAAGFNSDVVFGDYTLKVGAEATTIGDYTYQLGITGNSELALTIAAVPEPPTPTDYVAKFDVDGNGVSDVMFLWTGYNYAEGYWMNGTSEWRSTMAIHPAEWEVLGCYDMAGDGKADSVLVGNVDIGGNVGAYIGYYADGIDTDDNWVNIDYLNNNAGVTWINKVGNLTGGKANSIVWYAPDLYTLGAWTDGTSAWTTITGTFGGGWTMVGCGDFDGDGKDSVLMTAGGAMYYAADLDGTVTSMGNSNWSGWEVRAIGDFKGDGKEDLVLFHQELGSMVMCANGNLDDFESIGQLDAADWFVVGAGDYNGDKKDDLLVRQYSTGMLGYYTGGDVQNGWVELGRGVDMNWTVIA